MKSPLPIWRNRIRVCAEHIGRQAFRGNRAIQPGAVEIALRCIFRRRNEVNPLLVGANPVETHHVELAARDQLGFTGVSRHAIQMPPAVTLTQHQEFTALIDPENVAIHIHPRAVLIDKRRARGAGRSVSQQKLIPVLQPVHVLNQYVP